MSHPGWTRRLLLCVFQTALSCGAGSGHTAWGRTKGKGQGRLPRGQRTLALGLGLRESMLRGVLLVMFSEAALITLGPQGTWRPGLDRMALRPPQERVIGVALTGPSVPMS